MASEEELGRRPGDGDRPAFRRLHFRRTRPYAGVGVGAGGAFVLRRPVAASSLANVWKITDTADAASFASAGEIRADVPRKFSGDLGEVEAAPASRNFFACTARMRPLAASSGIPSMISRSNRPARRIAASSGLFVAPITVTCARRAR